MTNFDFLKKEQKFSSFADVAISAEKILLIDYSASILNCRRAMEFAVKWMYSVDQSLIKPWDDKLVSLMSTDEFRGIVDADLFRRMEFIRKMGNNAAHAGKKATKEQALLCLENLYIFMDFLAYCYADEYQEGKFNPDLITDNSAETDTAAEAELKLEELMKENAALREELTSRREEQQQTYVPKPLDISEYKTRKIYIDAMLEDAGWVEGKDWINEYEIPGMPNKSEVGYADYVLMGEDGRILPIIEAKGLVLMFPGGDSRQNSMRI